MLYLIKQKGKILYNMNKKIKSLIIVIILIVVVLGSFAIYTISKKAEEESYEFKIYFFNAGKADSILISNNDRYIMIDTGEESLSNEILNYFSSHNITKLDYLIITHFDKDHVGSASNIIDNIEVTNVLQSNYPKESEYYDNYINSLANKEITAKTISGRYTFALGDIKFTVDGPLDVYDEDESNNSSLIVRLNYKDSNYLFMGDSQNDRIKDYISENKDKIDFIKIPYHGNYQKKLDDLLETVEPKYAVITCSDTEPDTTKTEELLSKLGIEYYLSKNGSITVLSDGNSITIKQ